MVMCCEEETMGPERVSGELGGAERELPQTGQLHLSRLWLSAGYAEEVKGGQCLV
jgi:hypothetical protein